VSSFRSKYHSFKFWGKTSNIWYKLWQSRCSVTSLVCCDVIGSSLWRLWHLWHPSVVIHKTQWFLSTFSPIHEARSARVDKKASSCVPASESPETETLKQSKPIRPIFIFFFYNKTVTILLYQSQNLFCQVLVIFLYVIWHHMLKLNITGLRQYEDGGPWQEGIGKVV